MWLVLNAVVLDLAALNGTEPGTAHTPKVAGSASPARHARHARHACPATTNRSLGMSSGSKGTS